MNTNYTMSDEMALGFFDADGGIILGSDKIEGMNPSIIFKVVYLLNQSISKSDATVKFAEKFGGKTLENEDKVEFRVNQSSSEGQKFREFLTKNERAKKNPYRLRDFYISELIISLLKQKTQQSKVGKITLAYLVSNKSRLQKQGGDLLFNDLCSHINATEAEIQQGKQIVEPQLAKIEKKLEAYKQTLSKIKFSNDYVLGIHYGDGSLYVGLSWKPMKTDQRLRCEPEWAISGDNKDFCKIFAKQFGGITKPVDSKGQHKFTLTGIEKCLNILPLFQNASWMPKYKKEQFNRWGKAVLLLKEQRHFTEEGIRELLDLTYGYAEKGERPYSKEQYLEWGLAWLNKPDRQRRKSRG